MSGFNIVCSQKTEYTLVSNDFIDYFLGKANDAQIKVYLYLLRHKYCEQGSSVHVLADFFNFTEKDVLRALSFWEREGIMKIDYDEAQQPVTITLCDFFVKQKSPTVEESTHSSHTFAGGNGNGHPFYENSAPKEAVVNRDYEIKDKEKEDLKTYIFEKPDYTLEQLEGFQAKDQTRELVFIAESYLGKTLSSNDLRTLFYISETLHFSLDLMDFLLQYCIDRGKRDFRYIEKVAVDWAKNNITTPHEADSYATKYNKDVYTVMNALGKSSLPTPKEVDFIRRWYQIYGFTSDVVLEACERTVLATDTHRFEYADRILENWKNAGVHHVPDIDKLDAEHKRRKAVSSGNVNNGNDKNRFNQFHQNEYNFEDLEKELVYTGV